MIKLSLNRRFGILSHLPDLGHKLLHRIKLAVLESQVAIIVALYYRVNWHWSVKRQEISIAHLTWQVLT